MRQHENVLAFVGACTEPPDLCVVYERHASSLEAVHEQRPELAVRVRMACDGAPHRSSKPAPETLQGPSRSLA